MSPAFTLPGYVVGERDLFWVQPLYFEATMMENIGQYIFHGPLPPQPCDAELPCLRSGEVCADSGFCQAVSTP